jgi:osmoprotectant transport system substrate-binding protein
MFTRRSLLKTAAAIPLLGSAFTLAPRSLAQGEPIRVGSKDFTESIIIGEMYAQLLEKAGLQVERKLNLGGTAVAQEGLVGDSLDLYPEYTGTGLLVVLGKTLADVPGLGGGTPEAGATPVAGDAREAVYNYVKSEYQTQYNLTWLDQTAMNDSQALAVTRQFSEENGVTTISQLVALASSVELVFSAPVDFEEREDGLKGLKAVYGEFDATVNGVAPGIKYQSFLDGDANVVLAFSTDAEIAINDLVVLQDDKGLWPPYFVAPVVRQDALDANPGLAPALNALAPILTTELMTGLNAKALTDPSLEIATIAKDFLTEQGLL